MLPLWLDPGEVRRLNVDSDAKVSGGVVDAGSFVNKEEELDPAEVSRPIVDCEAKVSGGIVDAGSFANKEDE